MNKYQVALDYLISNGTHTTEYSWGDEIEVETERGEESVNLLQELVDKETPLPLNGYECPNGCKTFSYSERTIEVNRCDNCGQRINWNNYD